MDPDKVSHHIHRIGNHFPADVVQEACDFLHYDRVGHGRFVRYSDTLRRKLAAHKGKEGRQQIRNAIQELFPGIPTPDLNEISTHAWKKGSSRVGNSDMPLTRRVQLAVSAYVRHKYTDYDKLLKTVGYTNARSMVEHQTLAQLKTWRGEDLSHTETEEVFREFIVIDSDDESDDGENEESAHSDGASPNSLEFVSQITRGYDHPVERGYTDAGSHHAYILPRRRPRVEYVARPDGLYDEITYREPDYRYAPKLRLRGGEDADHPFVFLSAPESNLFTYRRANGHFYSDVPHGELRVVEASFDVSSLGCLSHSNKAGFPRVRS